LITGGAHRYAITNNGTGPHELMTTRRGGIGATR
jgi:hypothetical protein